MGSKSFFVIMFVSQMLAQKHDFRYSFVNNIVSKKGQRICWRSARSKLSGGAADGPSAHREGAGVSKFLDIKKERFFIRVFSPRGLRN